MSSSTLEEFLKTKSPQTPVSGATEQPTVANTSALQSFLGTELDKNAEVPPAAIKPRIHAGSPAESKSGAIKKLAAAAAIAAAPAAAQETTTATTAPGAAASVTAKPFPWFKHISMIESALRIGDVHFAETLLTVLLDVAEVFDDVQTRVRLKALSARIKMEQGQVAEAEKMLMETLSPIEKTPAMSTIGAAYCLHALAQCYKKSGKGEKADKAQAMSVALAEKLLGAADPEAKMFKQPLAV